MAQQRALSHAHTHKNPGSFWAESTTNACNNGSTFRALETFLFSGFLVCTWRVYVCGMIHLYLRRDSFIRVTWPIDMCGMTCSYVWHVSSIFATWIKITFDMTHKHVWLPQLLNRYILWLLGVYMYMTDSCVWHDSFICDDSSICVTWLPFQSLANCSVLWLLAVCMIRLRVRYVWHDSFICVAWLIHMCDMTH